MDQKMMTQTFDSSKLYVWVKGLEGKVNNLIREIEVIKNDYIKKNNQVKTELKMLTEEVMETKHLQEKMSQKMDLIIKELQQTAAKDDLVSLKKYLDLWNPLHFVTQQDIGRIIEEKMKEIKSLARVTQRRTAKKRKSNGHKKKKTSKKRSKTKAKPKRKRFSSLYK